MSLNYSTQIASLFDSYVGNDAKYQSPGTYGLSVNAISGPVSPTAIVTAAGSGWTSTAPTAAVSPDSNFSGVGTGATFSVLMKMLTASINAAGTGYVPGEVATLAITGGTTTTPSKVTVATTKVVSATVGAGGTGGTNGTQTVTGTTGTGTPFQASVTVSGNAITAVLSISVAGSYTVNPTLTGQPVTGAGLTGATLNVVMGAATITVSTAGQSSVIGVAATQASTTGAGTGLTLNTITWGVDSLVQTAPGSLYEGIPTVAISGGAGSGATATLSLADSSEMRVLVMIEVLRSLIASAPNMAEVRRVGLILNTMNTAAVRGGATFIAANHAVNAVKAGLKRFNRFYRKG